MPPIEVRIDKNIKNLTIVREPDTRRQLEYVAVAFLGALFVLGVLFYGWQRAQYLQYGYDIEKSQQRQRQLVQMTKQRHLDRDRLSNPSVIESRAREMGMVDAAPGQRIPVYLDMLSARR